MAVFAFPESFARNLMTTAATAPSEPSERLLTEAEVADYLRVHRRTLGNWRKRQTGPDYILVGAHNEARYPQESLRRWIAERQSSRLTGAEGPADSKPVFLQTGDLELISRLARLAFDEDPTGAWVRMADLFEEEFDERNGLLVSVSTWAKPVGPVYPLLSAGRGFIPREAAQLLANLVQELEALPKFWDRLAAMSAGQVPWTARRLAFRSLDRARADFRTPREPRWLKEASGGDIQQVLHASLLPVCSALKPNALNILEARLAEKRAKTTNGAKRRGA